jgi:hypothetical protein
MAILLGARLIDTIQCSVKDFFDMMERYQFANQLDPSFKQNQSKIDKDKSKKSTEKSNDKKHKAKPKKNDSDLPAPKNGLHATWTQQLSHK